MSHRTLKINIPLCNLIECKASSHSSMNQNTNSKLEVRRGKERKIKFPFQRDFRLSFLACFFIYPGLAPA